MDPIAAKYIAAGLACIGMGGAAIGVGSVFGQFLSGALRNPSAAPGEQGRLFLGFALAEAFGIFSLLIALLFVVRPLSNSSRRVELRAPTLCSIPSWKCHGGRNSNRDRDAGGA